MKIIIDWDTKDIYTEDDIEDITQCFLENQEIDDFEDYLIDHYSVEEIFCFSAEKKNIVRQEYEKYLKEVTAELIKYRDNFETISIDSDMKVRIGEGI